MAILDQSATNTVITPQVIARSALAALYNNTVLAQLVYRDYDSDFSGRQGDTITVRTPASFTAQEFNRVAGIQLQAITEGSFPVTLDKILDVSFAVTSEEWTLEIEDFETRILQPATEAIVQAVDAAIAEELVDAASLTGGGGVADGTGVLGYGAGEYEKVLIQARQKLTRGKLPFSERYAVLSPEASGALIGTELFQRADARGDTDGLREATVGRAFGLDTYESQVFGYGYGDRGQADGVAFHRQAASLVTRTLSLPKGATPATAAVESYKGLGVRVVSDYDITHKKDIVSIDFLYGLKTLRREAAIELNFGAGS